MLNVFIIHEFYHNSFEHHTPNFNMDNTVPRDIAVLPMSGLVWMQMTYVSRKSTGSPQGTLQNSDVPLVAVEIIMAKRSMQTRIGRLVCRYNIDKTKYFWCIQFADTVITGPVGKCLAIGYARIHVTKYIYIYIYSNYSCYINYNYYIFQLFGRKSKICRKRYGVNK